jgi:hypothetical protein
MNKPILRLVEAMGRAHAILITLAIGAVCVGALAHRASGTTWEPFAVQEEDGAQWCYDKQSVEVSGSVADAWVLVSEKDGSHSFAELKIWCDASSYPIMAGQQYDKNDEVLLKFREEKENWTSIGDGTCIEELYKAICPKMLPSKSF